MMNLHLTISGLIQIAISLVIAILVNSILGSFIKVPKRLDTKRGKTYVAVVRSIITIVIFAVELNFIFIILGIDLGPLLASAGIIGIALGIGSRSLFEDLIAGFFLLTQSKIAIGDYVSFGTVEGVITDITFRTVTFTSPNGALNFIPNGQIKHVINYSRGKAVILIEIPIQAGQGITLAQNTLIDIIEDMKQDSDCIIYDSSHVLGLQDIKPGGIIMFLVSLSTNVSSREDMRREYLLRVIEKFKKKKIILG